MNSRVEKPRNHNIVAEEYRASLEDQVRKLEAVVKQQRDELELAHCKISSLSAREQQLDHVTSHASPSYANLSPRAIPDAPAGICFLPPRAVSQIILGNYFDYELNHLYVLDEPTVRASYERVSAFESSQTDKVWQPPPSLRYDIFVVNMVIATGLAGLARGREVEAYKSTADLEHPSKRYYDKAMMYFNAIGSNIPVPSLNALTQILLVCQYELHLQFDKSKLWYWTGAAMSLAVELQLYQENECDTLNLGPLVLDIRRRLFWSAYSVDRLVCLMLDRPVRLADNAINTPLPATVPDQFVGDTEGMLADELPLCPKRIGLNHSISNRRIQSDIMTESCQVSNRHHSDEWQRNIMLRLDLWKSSLPPQRQRFAVTEFWNIHHLTTLLALYRPDPVDCTFNQKVLDICTQASSSMIYNITQLQMINRINMPFVGTRQLFRSALTLCFSAKYAIEQNLRFDTVAHDYLYLVDLAEWGLGLFSQHHDDGRPYLRVFQYLRSRDSRDGNASDMPQDVRTSLKDLTPWEVEIVKFLE